MIALIVTIINIFAVKTCMTLTYTKITVMFALFVTIYMLKVFTVQIYITLIYYHQIGPK